MNHRLIAGLTSAIMSMNMLTILPMQAFALDTEITVYEKEGYTVTYKVGSEWENNRSIEVTIENTGEESILNWALKYDVGGEVYNLWNSEVYESAEDYTIIKNNGYNYEIEAGQIADYGYIVTGEETLIPDDIELCSRRIDVKSGYEVDLAVTNDWYTGFNGEITVTNTSAEPIEAWTLLFDGNFTINNIWNAKLLSNEDGSYEIANQLWTTPIKPRESAVFGFTADKSATENAAAENFCLTAVVIGESSLEAEPVEPENPEEIDYELDSDSDGLSDYYEDILETDKNNTDTDGDSLSDGYEVLYLGTDPLKADSDDNGINDGNEDFDSDGLTNAEESELGTDPNSDDTDGDGLSDGAEKNVHGTDPLKFDSDEDGISDGDEITLGLNPSSSSTDGTPDNERTFAQTVGAESEVLAAVNEDTEIPFDVSLEITAAGVAENNVYVRESGYSNAIENSAIIGVAPEFVYTDGLTVEEVTIKFELDNSVVDNTLGIYANDSDEFKGIKRLNVFMFFEDINMLLPVETFHDESTNTVYTTTDRMGTYCLVDMEIFLDNLDKQLNNNEESEAEIEIQSEKSGAMSENPVDKDGYSCYAVNKSDAKAKVEDDFDAVFMIDCRDVVSVDKYAIIKKNIIETADTIFIKSPKAKIKIIEMLSSTEADGSNGAIKVVTRGDIGETTDVGSDYFCNIDEVYSALEFVTNNISSGKADCVISDAVEYIYQNYGGRKTYVFTIIQTKALFFRKGSKNAYDSLGEIIDGNLPINISTIFADKHTSKYGYALDIAGKTGGITSYTYEDTAELMLMHIYGKVPEVENGYKAIIATGYKTVVLNSSLQQNYEWYQQSAHYDVYRDTDLDGLCDYEEIKFASADGRSLVNDSNPNNVQLLTFGEIVEAIGNKINYYDEGEKHFYVRNGLKRYMEITGEDGPYPDSLWNVRILPINSDPTSEDGDKDEIPDKLDGFALTADNMPAVFKTLIINEKAKYDDILLINRFDTVDNVYLCNISLSEIFGEKCFLSIQTFDSKGNISGADEYLDNYYLMAYGEETDADYYAVKWYDYSFIKKIKVLNTTGKIRKYTKINYDELRSEYLSYDFWSSVSKTQQRWLKNVQETDEKNIANIRSSLNFVFGSAKYTPGYLFIEIAAPGSYESVASIAEPIITGFEIKAYNTISGITKTPSSILMMPSSAIEHDYLYRQNFKKKYGIDPGKYSVVSRYSYLIESQSDSLFMSIDEFDSEVISGTDSERMEYIGGKLWDICFELYLKELSQKINDASIEYEKQTGSQFDFEDVKNKLPSDCTVQENIARDMLNAMDCISNTEIEISDNETAIICIQAEQYERYLQLCSTIGNDFLRLMHDCGIYANDLVVLSLENEDAIKSLLETYYNEFVDGVNRYGTVYAELAIKYGEQFVHVVDIYPQYASDIIYLTNKKGLYIVSFFKKGKQIKSSTLKKFVEYEKHSPSPWVTIDKYREKKGLTVLGDKIPSVSDGLNTVSFIDVDGNIKYGLNSSLLTDNEKNLGRNVFKEMQNEGFFKKELKYGQGGSQVLTHAEGYTIMQACGELGEKLDGSIILYCDRSICSICNSFMSCLKAFYDLDEIIVINKDNSVHIY